MLHGGEKAAVVGGGQEHRLPAAEGVGHRLRLVAAAQIRRLDLGATGLQDLRQHGGGTGGVAVDGGVGHQHRVLLLRLVAAPLVVLAQVEAQVLPENRAVEGGDGGDVQTGGLLQQGLDLAPYLPTMLK